MADNREITGKIAHKSAKVGRVDVANTTPNVPTEVAVAANPCYASNDPLIFLNQIEWLTTEQAAKYLSLSVGALRNMTSNGQVPFYKLEHRNRYRLEDLRNLLLSQRRGGFHGN